MATFFNLDPRVVLAIGAALVLLGLALAFWGRGIWRRIMALIGMVLGGIIGFIAGYAIGGFTVGGYTISPYVLGLILSLIGALIGTLLFAKLVNIALALVIGLAAAALVFFSLGASTGTATLADARVIGAIIAFVVVFALSYYFIEELLAILTAAIGGALLGFGVYILLWPGGIIAAAAAGIGVFALGMIYQTMKVRRQKRVAASMGAPPTAWANPPPPQQ